MIFFALWETVFPAAIAYVNVLGHWVFPYIKYA